jgi:alpha-N-arabinofuranosidase
MREAGPRMNGLALHYYCGTGKTSRSATQFEEVDWAHQLARALKIGDLIDQHVGVMDRFDPQNKVALIVDEWGAWHAVEPGTNRGFLYQQNSLRDALVAGVSLNIFNNNCKRVKMANIAQTINVLQAMILTDKEKLIVTPTFHVYEMYTVHHDATLLPCEARADGYAFDGLTLPTVQASASRDKAGKINVTLCNLDPKRPAAVECQLGGAKVKAVSGRVLTAETMQAHNTFDKPEVVKPAAFDGAKPTADGFSATLPAKSVVVLTLE